MHLTLSLTEPDGCRSISRRTRNVIGSSADCVVALARCVLQSRPVEDDNVAPPISYQAICLQPVRGERDASPAHSQHPCKGLMCQRDLAFIYQVERLK